MRPPEQPLAGVRSASLPGFTCGWSLSCANPDLALDVVGVGNAIVDVISTVRRTFSINMVWSRER